MDATAAAAAAAAPAPPATLDAPATHQLLPFTGYLNPDTTPGFVVVTTIHFIRCSWMSLPSELVSMSTDSWLETHFLI